jgi:predicted RNA binding protein YcfA (HicA-like mRNA interferase family)
MKRGEMLRELKASGFRLVRNGRRHSYWIKGSQRVTVSHGSRWSEEMIRTLCIAIKRAKSGV